MLLLNTFYVIVVVMKKIDPDKERSEKQLPLKEFLLLYNKDLPLRFPHASVTSLNEFKKTYPALFKGEDTWSLDKHRKKFMDWRAQSTETRE